MESTRCAACGTAVTAESRFCGRCGANLAPSVVVTAPAADRGFRLQAEGGYPAEAGLHSRFPVGIVLGERYRILGLLGLGGMGEVYRAHDLKLEQQVALKFLPEAAAFNPSLMERFRGEVRIARQISHRNVCRVYDLGEINGAPFISMEYVDGEDLASLLRRIGRLPGDKALDFGRRLCAGLAAAHEKGVLHRDLKPANIMIDGRGQLLIMDFGLAAVADAISGHDIRSGTPAYMAPEQREGRAVTVRSDVYALGIVLAEMFSGSRPTADGTLTTTSKDVDPAIEKVIQRCVDHNPSKRFASALDVARALPGGDPLAEALAAGETPSPAMVAASDDTSRLSVRAAVACLALIVAGLVTLVYWGSRTFQVNLTPMPHSAEVLEQKAREMIAGFGYPQAPRDSHRQFESADGYTAWATRNLSPAERRRQLAQGQPPELLFRFVQSPQDLLPNNAESRLRADDPVRPPGSVEVLLDPHARLLFFRAVPADATTGSGTAVGWERLFEAAGLDASLWTSVDPQAVPSTAFNVQRAWTGTYPGAPQVPLRAEAAAWNGRPVFFEILGPWQRSEDPVPPAPRTVIRSIFEMVPPAILVCALLVAGRNVRSGRGDLSGATRFATFVAICVVVALGNIAHHPTQGGQIVPLALFRSAAGWTLYMAIEPYVRRHWPQVLIGWSRALDGKFRDSVVCGHILIGMVVGFATGNLHTAIHWLSGVPFPVNALSLYANRIGGWAADVSFALLVGLFQFFLFVLVRLVLTRTWVAAAAATLFSSGYALAQILPVWPSVYTVAFVAVAGALQVGIAMRFGLLALVANIVTFRMITGAYPVTSDFSLWYASSGLLQILFIGAVALWCFHYALGGRRLFKTGLLEG